MSGGRAGLTTKAAGSRASRNGNLAVAGMGAGAVTRGRALRSIAVAEAKVLLAGRLPGVPLRVSLTSGWSVKSI